MKIVLAFDSFKGSVGAAEACAIARRTLLAVHPDWEVVSKPMADGGEGTARILCDALGGQWIPERVMGPLPSMQVEAGYAWVSARRLAIIEMAPASGLTLLRPTERNPLLTTTYGTGQLLAAALRRRPDRIWLALGGSATVDGGVGAAAALGWEFLDADGRPVKPGGGNLVSIRTIRPPRTHAGVPVEVLCDVDNPLCGPQGAAAVFGPQKGATPAMVAELDAGLRILAERVVQHLHTDILNVPGAGAAGGLAAGALAFFQGRLVSGIDCIMDAVGLPAALRGADWLITGEGSFDAQSMHGKVVAGVARAAQQAGTRVAVIAGQVALSAADFRRAGIESAWALRPPGMPLPQAIAEAPRLLADRTRECASRFLAV